MVIKYGNNPVIWSCIRNNHRSVN